MGAKLDYVVDELFKMSQRGMADFLVPSKDGYTVDFDNAKLVGALNNIRELTYDRTGKITIKLYDQLSILELIGKLGDKQPGELETNFTLEKIVASFLRNKKDSEDDEIDDE